MIPYTLIIPSASRPHLLQDVLGSLMARVDQWPEKIVIHNDEVFPGKAERIQTVAREFVPDELKARVIVGNDNPPIKHGPSLKWLIDHVETEYVLYSQDDHRVIRPLPIRKALGVMAMHHLNQIRFNKRDTMDKKGREGEEFYKVEYHFGVALDSELGTYEVTLCAADHWYFQCGLWYVPAIRPVINWWSRPDAPGAFTEHCEYKINDVFNGKFGQFLPNVVPYCEPEQWNIPDIRAKVHRTFIWGKIGEPRFVEHIGHLPEDWALERANRDPQQRQV